MTRETPVGLRFGDEELEGVLVARRDSARRPGVILFPTVMGVSDLELGFARQLVHLGYTGFVADLFGKQFRGAPRDVMMKELKRLRDDRSSLRDRLRAVLETVTELEAVEADRIVAIGYCFGGQCALDLARSGADIAGVASFHGLLDPPGLPPQPIKAKVLAFHGWDDPMAPPEALVALGQELTEAGADWQIHAFGHVAHGFTNPGARGAVPGVVYNELAAERSWTSLISFLEELFG
ncbi:dienelactone hydrolase family protein [Sphingomonas sp.]|uniref:dienelactone hydrolase family protein n=1 Tax=Sphingomonas sp. TaxID=28214 RepID=UPI0017975256|nr:dienelactone hydrolase family protein [Sphingomonas sp.]MBA3511061.1 dienelactone hydrolase family protein [Sphingomonas sp.]